MSVNMDRAATLLMVAEKTAGHSGKLNSLGGEAIAELLAMNEEARTIAMDRAKVQAEKDAEIAARAAEDRKAQVDAEAKSVEDSIKPEPKAIPSTKPAVQPTLADRRI